MSAETERFRDALNDAPLPEVLSALAAARGPSRERAAAEILRRFHPLLQRYWRRCRTVDYRDFVQETMVRLFAVLPRLREPERFAGLMHSIAVATAADLNRKSQPVSLDLANADSKSTDESSEDGILASQVVMRSYLEILPPRERQVLLLSYFAGHDIAVIANQLGLSVGAVRMTRSRALRRLRAFLLKSSTGESP